MNVTGSRHNMPAAQPRPQCASQVMRDVEGDFVVTVKVTGEFKPGGKSTNPKSVPFNGAGIMIWSDADNFIQLQRAAVNRGGKISTCIQLRGVRGRERCRGPQRGDEGGRLLGAHGAQGEPPPGKYLVRRHDLEGTEADPDPVAGEAQGRAERDQFQRPPSSSPAFEEYEQATPRKKD